MEKPIQRWAPYVQGFSASFVDEMLQRFSISPGQTVLDPFAGSGTVLVAAKMKGIDAIGEVLCRIESDGVTYTGRGADTDIIVASAKAYMNALNRLLAGKKKPE